MRVTRAMIVVATTAAAVVLWLAISPSAAQQRAASAPPAPFPAYRAPRLDGHPNLNGIYQAFVTANIDLRSEERRVGKECRL